MIKTRRLLFVFIILLCGCNSNKGALFEHTEVELPSNEIQNKIEVPIIEDSKSDTRSIIDSTDYIIPIFSQDIKINEIYYDSIARLENTGFLPDGSYCYVSNGKDFQTQKQRAYPNEIAVCDLNGDSVNELLIRVNGTCNADCADYVYRYSKEKECFELMFSYYFGCDFYEGGLIYARVSHSQYLYNDDFWPYEIFKYSADTDKYESIAAVEKLDLAANPDYYTKFPYEHDEDHDKMVYIVNTYGEGYYFDEKEYNDWKEKVLDSKLIELNWYVV